MNSKRIAAQLFKERFQASVELTHQLGSFDVDRILVAKGSLLNAENKSEVFYVFMKLMEGETDVGVFVKIVKLKCLEVAEQQIAR